MAFYKSLFLRVSILLFFFGGNIPSIKAQQKITAQQYVDTYLPIAQTLAQTYGIPAEVIIGIGMYESNFGNSKVCRLLNNHHGLAGKNRLYETKGIKSRYKQFDSDSLGYVGFCEFVSSRKYFKTIPNNTSINDWLSIIGRNGYCQNPQIWKKHILQILKQRQLM